MSIEHLVPEDYYPEYLTTLPRAIAAVKDYEPFAREKLNDNAWAYLSGGASEERTLRENEDDFNYFYLKGKVLNNVSGGHTRLQLFGYSYEHPIFLSPVAYQKLFHPEGELAAALGASVMKTPMVVSTLASTRWEKIVNSTSQPLWFQLYIQRDRDYTLELVKRAEENGFQAIVVTVDAPIAGIRHREHRANFQLPLHISAVNLEIKPELEHSITTEQHLIFDHLMKAAPTWEDIRWLVSSTSLPIIIKGILDADDALQAEACGVSAIIVSNHGGRVLDGLPSTIRALPAIAAALQKRIPILLDGGIRRGCDIFKAIALGASAILIGRPYIYGLSTAGALGVAHVIRILREELEITMAISGCKTLQDIQPNYLLT